MPLYDVECIKCNKKFEVLAKIDEKVSCSICGQEVTKLVTNCNLNTRDCSPVSNPFTH